MITGEFILIQLIGILAWLMLIISYYRDTTNKILVYQIIGTVFMFFIIIYWEHIVVC